MTVGRPSGHAFFTNSEQPVIFQTFPWGVGLCSCDLFQIRNTLVSAPAVFLP